MTRHYLEQRLIELAELSTKCYSRYIMGLTKNHQKELSGLMGYLCLYEYALTSLTNSDVPDDVLEYEGKKWIDLYETKKKAIERLWPHFTYK